MTIIIRPPDEWKLTLTPAESSALIGSLGMMSDIMNQRPPANDKEARKLKAFITLMEKMTHEQHRIKACDDPNCTYERDKGKLNIGGDNSPAQIL